MSERDYGGSTTEEGVCPVCGAYCEQCDCDEAAAITDHDPDDDYGGDDDE